MNVAGLGVADRWFERRALADGVTRLWEPHVHPLVRCNLWHVRGRDRDLLVDTGLGVASVRTAIADLLDKPLVAVATHIHYDHVGGLHEFDARVMHQIEAPRMERYEELATLVTATFPDFVLDDLRARGYAIEGDTLIDALPRPGYDLAAYAVVSAVPTRVVDEGDLIDTCDRFFEVLHLPGHSPGSMGLWEKATGILFAGDAIYDGPLLDELPDSDIPAYLATMKRLRELPATIVHAGHEPSFGRERLVELADAYLAWRGRG
jgi:glyoxylase-like metal-dependent hydrolase (beta-lactamase superfamily II)